MTTTSTDTSRYGAIRKGSAAHTMLLVLKFYRHPATFHEMREIAPTKINANVQRRWADSLIQSGYAVELPGAPGEPSRFQITQRGIDKLYDMGDPPKYQRKR
jgi:hypothetical protein